MNFPVENIANGDIDSCILWKCVDDISVCRLSWMRICNLLHAPQPRMSTYGEIEPVNEDFSGFIFKIQANMNPMHRDRIAFLRICSGKFERGMTC